MKCLVAINNAIIYLHCLMKYSFLLILAFISSSAWGQILFERECKDCLTDNICLYCGDSPARPSVKLGKYLQKRLDKAQFEYNGRGLEMRFQIYVDAAGKVCVLSIDDRYDMWQLRKDLLIELNHMPNWAPALKDGQPIGSSMVLVFNCYKDHFDIRFISKRPLVDGRVI